MWRKLIAVLVALMMPTAASAGPLRDAVEKSGQDIAAQAKNAQELERGRGGRFWTSMALIGGGAALSTFGLVEIGDDESGPDDGEDADDSDDGEDSDVNKAMLGGGIAAAALGTFLLFTGKKSGPKLSVGPKGVAVQQTVRF
jgi:hypothetical protein